VGEKAVIKRIITLAFWNEAIFSSQIIIRCQFWILKLILHTGTTLYHIKFAFTYFSNRNIEKIKIQGNSNSIWPFDLATDLKILSYVCWCPKSFSNFKLLAKRITTELWNFHVLKWWFFFQTENYERISMKVRFELAYEIFLL